MQLWVWITAWFESSYWQESQGSWGSSWRTWSIHGPSEPGEVARADDASVNADNSFLGVVNEDPPVPAHPHSVWVFCPKAECKVNKMRVEIDIMHKRRCKKCGARNQDNCTCRSCEDCNEGNCCNNCVCCDSRHDPLTEEEILLNGGCLKCMQWVGIRPTPWLFRRQEGITLATKILGEVSKADPPLLVWTKFRLLYLIH